jgi:thiol:disulfide interchange protein DsbD
MSKDKIHAGETFKVAVLAKMSPGWHIHANKLTDEFLIPTEVSLGDIEKIEVLEIFYPEPREEKYEYSDVPLLVYEGEALFGLLIKTEKDIKIGVHKLEGELSFQACDHSSCLPPKSVTFGLPLKVVEDSEETLEIQKEVFAKIKFKEELKK